MREIWRRLSIDGKLAIFYVLGSVVFSLILSPFPLFLRDAVQAFFVPVLFAMSIYVRLQRGWRWSQPELAGRWISILTACLLLGAFVSLEGAQVTAEGSRILAWVALLEVVIAFLLYLLGFFQFFEVDFQASCRHDLSLAGSHRREVRTNRGEWHLGEPAWRRRLRYIPGMVAIPTTVGGLLAVSIFIAESLGVLPRPVQGQLIQLLEWGAMGLTSYDFQPYGLIRVCCLLVMVHSLLILCILHPLLEVFFGNTRITHSPAVIDKIFGLNR